MVIDLEKFAEEKVVIMPMVNGWGRCGGRLISGVANDGWYKIRMGNGFWFEGKASPLEIEESLKNIKQYRGLVLGNEVVPWNFENLFRKGEGETVEVHFLDLPAWEIVKFVRWEDNRFYSAGTDYSANRKVIEQVKEAFEKEQEIGGIKGVTPEIRYYFLLLSLQRHSFREFQEFEKLKLSQAEREKRIEEFRATFSGRLQETIEKAGGKLVRFTKRGKDKFTVVWKIGEQKITSIIKDDMRIYDLGFCASGHDREHTMASAIQLAKIYQEEEGDIYITRE